MCGIAGIWNFDGRPVRAETLQKMADAIRHRGPDDEGGLLIDSHGALPPLEMRDPNARTQRRDLGLANRRLSILDLSSLGHQPMEFGGCTLVYNGEIYNYLELAEELKALGHAFVSRSDTEVLLHAYLEWGDECLKRFNGIFSFALWDSRKQRLFCARDRLGVKPFCYFKGEDSFIFCSELKGILAVWDRKPRVNEAAVIDHLTSGNMDHTDDTFFEDLNRLPAGCYLELTACNCLRIERYWDVSKVTESNRSLATHVEEFSELFRNAIELQMRSDVDVACCLSGGLDSSAVVSLAAPKSPYRMRTYTARFHDRSMDEWNYARSVHEIKPVVPVAVYANPRDFWDNLDQVVWDQEEPFGDPSAFSQWNLMRHIHRDGIKVVLDGQGGDELLCGYAKYFYFSVKEKLQRKDVLGAGLAVGDALYRRGNHLFNLTGARRYLPAGIWLDRHSANLLQPDFARRFADRTIHNTVFNVRGQQLKDITLSSLPVLLRYEDRNSMAHSIESRVPFLDHRLVELAVSLPTAHKIKGSLSKFVLRRALANDMPKKVLSRSGKLGFGGTYRSWLDAISTHLDTWLGKPNRLVDRFVQPTTLRKLYLHRDPLLFNSLIIDRWMERFGLS